MRSWRRALVWTALFALAMVVLRVGLEARGEIRLARDLERAGQGFDAAIHYERAIHWYLPGSPIPREGVEALQRLARRAEGAGNRDEALREWRMLRSSLLAVRSLRQPLPEHLAAAEVEIARLMATDTFAPWPEPRLPPDQRRAAALENLRDRAEPDPWWALVMEVAFIGWVAAAVGFILRVFGDPQGWNGRAAARWGTPLVLAYALWLVGLARA